MPFLLLICLMVACLPITWPEPPQWLGVSGSIAATWGIVCGLLLTMGVVGSVTLQQLADEELDRFHILRKYHQLRTFLFFANLILFWVSILVLGWGSSVRELGTIATSRGPLYLPGMELVLLSPFLVTLIGSWAIYYDVDRFARNSIFEWEQRGPFWSRGGYVLFLLRQNLVLVFLPLILLMFQQGGSRLFPEASETIWARTLAVSMLPIFLVLFPLILPALLGLKPLPAGPLRARLEGNANRLGFRYSNIFLWDTRGGIANAMVVGLIPQLRYVIFTDRLLAELTDEEIDAVLGHEVGHVRHGHIAYYAFFLMLSFIFLAALHESARLANWFPQTSNSDWVMLLPVLVIGGYMFLAFGFLSRRCERQADVFGCKAGSCTQAWCTGHDIHTVLASRGKGLCRTGIASFIHALQRVESINGSVRSESRRRGSGIKGAVIWLFRHVTTWLHTWQHSTIANRIAFLEKIAADPRVEERFQQRLAILKWFIVLALGMGLMGLVWWKGWVILERAL